MRSITLHSVIIGMLITGGCVSGHTSGSRKPSASANIVVVEAARAPHVLACAEEQFRAAGYATHRDARRPLAITADRETSTGGDAYEVNVAGTTLSAVDGIPEVLRLWVSAETREFRSRGFNSGYSIRPTPRADVSFLVQGVMTTCAKA